MERKVCVGCLEIILSMDQDGFIDMGKLNYYHEECYNKIKLKPKTNEKSKSIKKTKKFKINIPSAQAKITTYINNLSLVKQQIMSNH